MGRASGAWLALALLLAPDSVSARAAFPSAVGWGREATGWRGGDVIKVTTTADAGAGSLRACLQTNRPRVCLIQTAGTIELDQPIFAASNVYLAGQAAPGDGIQIKLAASNGSDAPIYIENAHDVVFRYLRIRPGPGQVSSPDVDAITVINGQKLIFDHLSLAYSTDELFNVHFQNGSSTDITLQNTILAYALQAANHPDGPHSKGALLCSGTLVSINAGYRCGRITLFGNLFAHNNDRNPDLELAGLVMEVVNNIIYNPSSEYLEVHDAWMNVGVNYVGNVALEGPSTSNAPKPYSVRVANDEPGIGSTIYVDDNIDEDHRPTVTGAEDSVIDPTLYPDTLLSVPNQPMTGPLYDPEDLLSVLLNGVGATKPARDTLDAKVINTVGLNLGGRINNPTDNADIGGGTGYPVLTTGTAPADQDGDGMPDDWEQALPGLRPTVNDAWGDRDSDGWSNLEEFLSVMAGETPDPRT